MFVVVVVVECVRIQLRPFSEGVAFVSAGACVICGRTAQPHFRTKYLLVSMFVCVFIGATCGDNSASLGACPVWIDPKLLSRHGQQKTQRRTFRSRESTLDCKRRSFLCVSVNACVCVCVCHVVRTTLRCDVYARCRCRRRRTIAGHKLLGGRMRIAGARVFSVTLDVCQ